MSAAPCHPNHTFRYYDFAMVALVTVPLYSNLTSTSKVAQVTSPVLGSVTLGADVLSFPIPYIFGDILIEVYSHEYSRRVVRAGSATLIFAPFMSPVVLVLSVVLFMVGYQRSLNDVSGNTPRIVTGSLITFWCGNFTNSYILAKMKITTERKWLWTCVVGSTVMGEAVDSSLSYVAAFCGIWPHGQMLRVAIAQYILKTGREIVATPLTYRVVTFPKRVGNENYYDHDTSFTPFRLEV